MAHFLGKCKLCHQEPVALRKSHLIPAAAYRAIYKSLNRSPIIVKPDFTIQKDEQITAHILCSECEQRFNNGGERWVMKHCRQADNGFRLRDILEANEPIAETGGTKLYSASTQREIDIERLTYFASSVLWRGSVHNWRSTHSHIEMPQLGRYEELMRTYLLGDATFPTDSAIWISIISDSMLSLTVSNPYGAKTDDGRYWLYKFVFLGILFTFFIGRGIPEFLRHACSYRSPEKFIFVGDKMNEMVLKDLGGIISKSKVIGSRR